MYGVFATRNCFLHLHLRRAKSQKSFATTPFLRLQNANMVVQKLRLKIYDMSYSFRHEGLNSIESKDVDEIEETISALVFSIGSRT